MELKPIPQALRNILGTNSVRKTIEFDTAKKYNGAGLSKYGETALASECSKIASAVSGTRNSTLNTSSFTIGQLVAGGEIEYNLAYGRLFDAGLSCGLDQDEVDRTIASGMPAGMDNPRSSKPLGEPMADIEEALWIKDCPDPKLIKGALSFFNLLDYRPEDGGILDLWDALYGERRIFAVGFDEWFIWGNTHCIKDDKLSIVREIEQLIDLMNEQARKGISEATENEDKKFWGKYVNATQRTRNRVVSVEGMARARRAQRAGACGPPRAPAGRVSPPEPGLRPA